MPGKEFMTLNEIREAVSASYLNATPHINKQIAFVRKKLDEVLELESLLASSLQKIVLFGQIGTGKSSVIASWLPSVELSESEMLEKVPSGKKGKYRFVAIDNSRRIERSSILPVGKGRTTLTQLHVSYSPDHKSSHVVLVCKDREETEKIVREYVEYIYSDKKQDLFFPSEMATFLNNIAIKSILLKQKQKHGASAVAAYLSNFVKTYPDQDGRESLFDIFMTAISASDTKKQYIIRYTEGIFDAMFPKISKKYKKESAENRELRFLKKYLEVINKGLISNIGIPHEIILNMKNDQPYSFVFYDTKGTENTVSAGMKQSYINSDIVNFADDQSVNIILLSRINDAPTEDIKQILSEPSLYEKIKDRSLVCLVVRDNLSEEELYRKFEDTHVRLPKEMKDNVVAYSAFDNIGIPQSERDEKTLYGTDVSIWKTFIGLDIKRRKKLEEKRQKLIKECSVACRWFDKAISENEKIELQRILSSLDYESRTTMYEKMMHKIALSQEIFEMISWGNASKVYATTNRNGSYADVDVISVLKAKGESLIGSIFGQAKDKLTTELFNSPTFTKESREYLSVVISDFIDNNREEIETRIKKHINTLSKDNAFWEITQSEWGLGIPGYRDRVYHHIELNSDCSDIEPMIEKSFLELYAVSLLDMLLVKQNNMLEEE